MNRRSARKDGCKTENKPDLWINPGVRPSILTTRQKSGCLQRLWEGKEVHLDALDSPGGFLAGLPPFPSVYQWRL
jgi:hypothetical protein